MKRNNDGLQSKQPPKDFDFDKKKISRPFNFQVVQSVTVTNDHKYEIKLTDDNEMAEEMRKMLINEDIPVNKRTFDLLSLLIKENGGFDQFKKEIKKNKVKDNTELIAPSYPPPPLPTEDVGDKNNHTEVASLNVPSTVSSFKPTAITPTEAPPSPMRSPKAPRPPPSIQTNRPFASSNLKPPPVPPPPPPQHPPFHYNLSEKPSSPPPPPPPLPQPSELAHSLPAAPPPPPLPPTLNNDPIESTTSTQPEALNRKISRKFKPTEEDDMMEKLRIALKERRIFLRDSTEEDDAFEC